MIEFAKLDSQEFKAVGAIVDRATGKWLELDRLTLRMDLQAVHARTPLRLKELADAPEFDFAHDIFGITGHMDRETGTLTDCFIPRFAI